MSAKKPIPEFSSYEEIVEFWDTHTLADYWDQTEPVEFEISEDLRRRFLVPLDHELLNRVQQLAHARGISSESMVNLLIEQRLTEIEDAEPDRVGP